MKNSAKEEELQHRLHALKKQIDAQPELQTLLDNSASWAAGKSSSEQKSRRTAWRVASGFGALTLCAFGIAASAIVTSMQPAAPPQILVVDKSTGRVEPLVSLAAWQATSDDVAIKRLVATFLRARENYSFDTAKDNYLDAAAFMNAAQKAQWVAAWDTANPTSPPNVLKKDGKIRIDIGAMTILRNTNNVATGVRASFTRTVKRNDQLAGPVTAWIATIPFHWTNVPTAERDRRVNDLGMELGDYIVDADLTNMATAPVAPAAAPKAPSMGLILPVAGVAQ